MLYSLFHIPQIYVEQPMHEAMIILELSGPIINTVCTYGKLDLVEACLPMVEMCTLDLNDHPFRRYRSSKLAHLAFFLNPLTQPRNIHILVID